MISHSSRAIIVVPAAQQAAANAAALAVSPVGGDKTFTVPLSLASANTVPVAYWCNWQMTPAQRTQLALEFFNRTVPAVFHDLSDWDPAVALPTPASVLTLHGYVLPPPSVVAALAQLAVATVGLPWYTRAWNWVVAMVRRIF